jgi:CBS domain-containing protein
LAAKLHRAAFMHFKQAVSAYMSTDVTTVTTDAMLAHVGRLLEGPRFSAVPVVTPDGKLAGVITRTELLHAGRIEPGERPGMFELVLPELKVAAYLSSSSPVCAPTATLQQAARLMVASRYHRLTVVDDGRVVGMISTQRLVAAVRDARLTDVTGVVMMQDGRVTGMASGLDIAKVVAA